MKIQYVLLFMGLPHHIPQSVNGRSGKSFGYAQYSKPHGAHMISFDQETWDKHGLDIFSWIRRRTYKSLLKAEIVPDPDAPETKYAEEIDLLKTQVYNLTGALDDKTRDVSTLIARITELESAPSKTLDPATDPFPPVDLAGNPFPATTPIVVQTAAVLEVVQEAAGAQPPPEVQAPMDKVVLLDRLLTTPYRALRDMAKVLNEAALKSEPPKPLAVSLTPAPKLDELARSLAEFPEVAALLPSAE